MTGKLIIFSAPSGSGKTTIVQHLLSLNLKLEFSISATSRAPRGKEQHGKEYYFLSPDEFREKIDNGEFLEWEQVYTDQYYGTLRSEVERIRKEGKHIVFDIDVVGGLNLKKEFGEQALAIFVKAPSVREMEKRLRARNTDSEEQIKKRLAKAEEELNYATSFDHIIINDRLDKAKKEAELLIAEFTS